ncbi:hypothetical protein FACS1894176_11440 [Bacteroidia bacterium]|nr:hypothetical protein FACS1894176_11440 [Bacteroidia bacterium]
MRHAYFHRAVMLAFEPFIPAGEQPNYFIYLTIDPASIDVNIHPTKTEIKFVDEQMLFQVIASAIKEAIAVPALEFDREGSFDIPVYTDPQQRNTPVAMPRVQMRSDYNPFKDNRPYERPKIDWEQLYPSPQPPQGGFGTDRNDSTEDHVHNDTPVLQFKNKYLITSLKSGLAVIDQRRAHIRILFDEYFSRIENKQGVSQRLIFPEIIEFTPQEMTVLPCIMDDLAAIGFDLADLGGRSYSINAIPAGLENVSIIETLQNMVDKVLETGCEVQEEVVEALTLALVQKAAIPYGKTMPELESSGLIAKLFASTSPNYTPDGKLIISILPEEELSKRFK